MEIDTELISSLLVDGDLSQQLLTISAQAGSQEEDAEDQGIRESLDQYNTQKISPEWQENL